MASLFKLGSPVGLKKALLNSIESSASIIGICSTSESCFATARESGICCRPRNFCANHSNPSTKANRQMFRHSPTLPLDSMREVTAINANPDRATAANDTAANDTAANDTAANDQPQLMPGTCILPSINHDGTKRVKVSGLGEKVIDWPGVAPHGALGVAWIKIPLAHASGKQTAAPLGAEKVAFDFTASTQPAWVRRPHGQVSMGPRRGQSPHERQPSTGESIASPCLPPDPYPGRRNSRARSAYNRIRITLEMGADASRAPLCPNARWPLIASLPKP